MKSKDIFIQLEKEAIKWAKKYQIAKVGDVISSKGGGKTIKKYKISDVQVTTGRNAQKTTQKTLVILYYGRKINSKGECIDPIGTGTLLFEFTTEDGKQFNHSENEVTEYLNEFCFTVDFDPEAKKLYPKAYLTYKDNFDGFYYSR
jgi:hypothetical protein